MSKEPVHKKVKYSQTKLNFNVNDVTSLTSTPLEPGPSTQEPAQPEKPQSSNSVPAETVETAGTRPKQASVCSDCVEGCCWDTETGKAAQLIIERYFNSEWYRNREWLILCKTAKRAFCEICRFAPVKQLATVSKCGDDSFVRSGIYNWKKCPCTAIKSLTFTKSMSKKCAYFSQTPVNI